MPLTVDRVATGITGEDLACAELERRGYAILDRRYRSRFGEIDIICRHDGFLVFVEVRARRTSARGSAVESLTVRKQRRIGAMALDYLAYTGNLQQRCRFDVVAIDGFGTDAMTLAVIENAFVWDG